MVHLMRCRRSINRWVVLAVSFLFVFSEATAWAQAKAERMFTAVITDSQGIDTEVKNLVFYWEEKVSETAFVPHELRQLPVKRGTATVSVKFETIKQIEAKPGTDKGLPSLTITLTNGKAGEFTAAMNGSFRGESDFGQVDLPVNSVTKVMLK